MEPKIVDGSILESGEELIVIGMRLNSELDDQFIKEVVNRYPPVLSFFRRWTTKESVSLGDFQTIPGLFPEGAMVRPGFCSLVTSSKENPMTRRLWAKDSLSAAWDELSTFGYNRVALHAPSILRGDLSPVISLRSLVTSMDLTFPDQFHIYGS